MLIMKSARNYGVLLVIQKNKYQKIIWSQLINSKSKSMK